MTLLTADSPEHIDFDQIVGRDPTGLIVIYFGTAIIYFGAIGGAMSELSQTSNSYRNFAEFKLKVRDVLSNEEIAVIEKSVNGLKSRPRKSAQ